MALLLVVLPFQSLAAALLDLQGRAHVHAGEDRGDDDHHHDHHDDGHDHAQAPHRHDEQAADARVAAHDHRHGPFDRHHHEAGDATVVMVDDDGGEEGAGGWSATLCAAIPFSRALHGATRLADAFAPGCAARFRSRVPGLPDRPPRFDSL